MPVAGHHHSLVRRPMDLDRLLERWSIPLDVEATSAAGVRLLPPSQFGFRVTAALALADETKRASSSLRPSQLRARFESRFLPPASFPVPDPCGGHWSIAGPFQVIVLKFMELWDVTKEYESNTMPTYKNEELQQVREKYVCDWILDVDNVLRDEVLQDLGLM
ncbi:hypothetical protein LR48_Vigan05g044400 [Vigna angularis]|uniref:Ubiquitin-like protease family profile domain-containing protein n=1 Tax=Phaseolus angularis TaxID=3914 RepID=A0A0L9UIV6_PHAAN|nr:hypothetical protein LR48_Vigan05g044400 [Vigna angularis]